MTTTRTDKSRLARLCRQGHEVVGPGRLRVLLAVLRLCDGGRCTTHRELAAALGLAINAVRCHLNALRRAGLLTREPGHARTIRPTCLATAVPQ